MKTSMDQHSSVEEQDGASRNAIAERNRHGSAFLRLPAELRGQIHEYVLCNKNIHIGIRRRQPMEEGGYPREAQDPIKLMHALCLCQRTFSEAHQLSKQPEPDIGQNFDEYGHLKHENSGNTNILLGYYIDHKPCNAVLHDLQWREYMSFPRKDCSCAFPCIHYFQYRKSQIDEFGEPPGGLEVKYATTKYDLSLLHVCTQIHKEAALLPYSGNTFAFQNHVDMDLFLDKVLLEEQRHAIQRLNVCIRSLVNPTLPTNMPAKLNTLECFILSDDGDWRKDLEPWKGEFENVKVVSGWDGRRSVFEEPRETRRHRAERLENFLTKERSAGS